MPRETTQTDSDLNPLKRLEGLLNVLPNGGQTLTILAMSSRLESWTSYGAINAKMNRQVGFPVVRSGSTQSALARTLEPISIAARSTIDDKDWALTKFGVDLKPTLIFGWKEFIELDVDTPALLSSVSLYKRDQDETGYARTAGMTRFRIMQAIPEIIELSGEPGKTKVSEIEISDYTGFPLFTVINHTDALARAKFLEKRTKEKLEGRPISTFKVTEKGSVDSDWHPFANKRQRFLSFSERVYDALSALRQEGSQITIQLVREKYTELFPEHQKTISEIPTVLAFWTRPDQGYLEREGFSVDLGSELSLSPITQTVLTKVLLPLERWAYDPDSVEDINKIREQLIINPDAFVPLYSEIAQSYFKYSPYKNSDTEGKTAEALKIISESGEIAYADLARAMNVSTPTANKAVAGLLANGVIRRVKAIKGNKVFLVLNDN